MSFLSFRAQRYKNTLGMQVSKTRKYKKEESFVTFVCQIWKKMYLCQTKDPHTILLKQLLEHET